MCGIAAISLAPGSKINARALAHELLTAIENRGSHASGFAWVDQDGDTGVYKQAKPGSQLSLGELPRNAKSVILHTRYATQGEPSDNHNNHPVISTDNRIALVHNGVISNDHILRGELGITKEHGLVDSLVIPSLIAQQGIPALKKLSGYAAIAWIDGYETDGIIRIAKLKTSPVAFTHLLDGSFVMASTPALLKGALDRAGLHYGGVFEMAEQRLISVVDGFIYDHEIAPLMSYNYQAYQRHSSATSGGHSTTTPSHANPNATKSAQPVRSSNIGAVGSEVVADGGGAVPAKSLVVVNHGDDADKSTVSGSEVTAYYEDLEKWRAAGAKRDEEARERANKFMAERNAENISDTPLALSSGLDLDTMSPSQWDAYVEQLEVDEALGQDADDAPSCSTQYQAGEGYYVVDHEGDMSHFATLDDLEGYLSWVGKMTRSDSDLFEVDEEINWINHVWDMGAVDDKGELVSWVEDMGDIDNHESDAVYNLQYLRDGASKLATLKGA